MPFNKSSTVPSVKRAIKTTAPSIVYLEGYLYKQKHGKCRSWLKRYFVLYGEELRYYKTKNDTNALAVISLNHYSLVPDAESLVSLNFTKQSIQHTFCLISDDDSKYNWPDYCLQASHDVERHGWVEALQRFTFQSTSVLDKWLGRVDLPEQLDDITFSPQRSTSCSYLPSHVTKSFESLSKNTVITRRPSDYVLAASQSLMSSSSSSVNSTGKMLKFITNLKTKSSRSSVASTIDSLIHIPQEQDEDTPYKKAPEVSIINPKDFDNFFPSNSVTTEYYYRKQ